MRNELDSKEKDIHNLEEERDWLADHVEQQNKVSFFDDDNRKYSCELRECIYSLLGINVSANNIEPVIKTVLSLVGKSVDKLPSRSTILNCNVERLILSQNQLNEKLQDENNLTLYTDETTKFGTK